MIRDVQGHDSAAICSIYNHYVENTVITFEEQPISTAEMQKRIRETTKELPWLVFEEENSILGYAYASHWKGRCAYRYTAESTVYLSTESAGKGIGTQLYKALIDRLGRLSFHSVVGAVALPNPASVALHERMGFEQVALFKEVGWKMNRWVDVGYWELIIQNTKQAASLDADKPHR